MLTILLATILFLNLSPCFAWSSTFLDNDKTKQSARKPNVIVFLIDDLGWKDLGCYGSTFYQTPNLDKLAASGVRFTQSYSANPVCSPTRAALLTGKAPQRVGITQWIHQPSDIHLPKEEITVAETFQKAGYKTGYIGKWHLGEKDDQLPNSNGFDWMKCVNRAGQPAHYFYPYKKKSKRGNYWDVPDLEDGKKGEYLTDRLTDYANKFLEENQEKPFFLYMAHYAVHTPIQSPPELVKKYKEKRESVFGKSKTPFAKEIYNTFSRGRQDQPAYAAMMENLDTNIGRIMKKVKDLGLEENTIIVFTSDNGGHCHLRGRNGYTSNKPLRSGKGWTFEGGIRIPTIIAWKGKIHPLVSDVPTISMDLYPTLLELTGQQLLPGQHLDGKSMVPAIEKKKSKLKDRALFWTYPHRHGSGHRPSHAVRKGDWKLVWHQTTKKYELFNLKDDLGETKDLSDDNKELAIELKARLAAWLKGTKQEK